MKQNDIFGEPLHILFVFFLSVLIGQNLSWTNFHAGVLQGSILDPLLFLMYVNDFLENLTTNAKRFADDTWLFLVVHDVNTSRIELNDNLKKVNDWTF